MSDNIPFDIQYEIMKRLPIKPLIQFRSVSKAWKSLIDSSDFITNYHLRKTQPEHLLVSYAPRTYSEYKYVSIADDDTFPQHTSPLTAPVSEHIQPTIYTSQGLVCIFYRANDPNESGFKEAVIWNPTVRKSVSIDLPNYRDSPYETVFGFGVCPKTCDPKLVKVTYNRSLDGGGTIVDVFSLATRAWRRLAANLPRKSIAFTTNIVSIDRFIYWHAYQEINGLDADLIVSFDMMSEEFKEICLPDSLALDRESLMSIYKLGESLVVVQNESWKRIKSVWEMEDGVLKLFKKFTFKIPDGFKYASVLGFKKSGEVITAMRNDLEKDALVVYNTNSEKSTHIGITGKQFALSASSYMETLLLLNH